MADPNRLLIGEFMIPLELYPHLPSSATIQDALTALGHQPCKDGTPYFRHLLVLKEDGGLEGILSIHTLLKAIEPSLLKREARGAAQGYWGRADSGENVAMQVFWERLLADRLETRLDLASRTAGDLAEPVRKVLSRDDMLAHGLEEMVACGAFVLPVVKDDKVVGALRLADIFDLVVKHVLGEVHERGA
ncbi:CBS domain-containing protein [Thioalkalivibrio thiocyanoxidans]|uniref:CBS domain-containing protein n=1 Tax=Thioalkalivibrio thiocyanoxidans TaxID=152475 RepID=UPI00038023D1|nr:CBS domain-containing protein [Thioalkalivibrio thiocyanoxidans]